MGEQDKDQSGNEREHPPADKGAHNKSPQIPNRYGYAVNLERTAQMPENIAYRSTAVGKPIPVKIVLPRQTIRNKIRKACGHSPLIRIKP